MNNYILNYDPFAVAPTAGQLLNHVKINRHIQQYYQPFAGTYLLKSSDEIHVVNDSFKGLFETNQYLIVHFASDRSAGMLPSEIWAWLNTGAIPLIQEGDPANRWLAALLEHQTKPPASS